MPDLTEATVQELKDELLGREEFDGAIVSATLGEGAARDQAAAEFTASIAGHLRKNDILTAARERLEKP